MKNLIVDKLFISGHSFRPRCLLVSTGTDHTSTAFHSASWLMSSILGIFIHLTRNYFNHIYMKCCSEPPNMGVRNWLGSSSRALNALWALFPAPPKYLWTMPVPWQKKTSENGNQLIRQPEMNSKKCVGSDHPTDCCITRFENKLKLWCFQTERPAVWIHCDPSPWHREYEGGIIKHYPFENTDNTKKTLENQQH